MLGPQSAALLCEVSLEDHIPQDHLPWSIDRFVDLSGIRAHLVDFSTIQAARQSILTC